jgi:hypothetical protein
MEFSYDEYGFPICPDPECGEDALYSTVYQTGGTKVPPTLSAYYAWPFGCRECGGLFFDIPYPKPWEVRRRA